jgi:phosphoenolpyruvate carboxylase
LLDQLNQDAPSPSETETLRAGLHEEIAALWLTDRARTTRPSVTDEVRTGLYFLDSVFWETLPRLYDDLDRALALHYPGLKTDRVWLRLASWIGGDRDGNPNVTYEVTAETLRLHRGLAVENHRRTLHELARHLSVSARQLPAPPALMEWIEKRRPLPPHVEYIAQRYANEPFRQVLSLLVADLAEASRKDMTASLLSGSPHQARVSYEDLSRPLEIIASSLPAPLRAGRLLTVRRQVDIFGMHALRLDIREDSSRLNAAVGEVLRALEIAPAFETSSEDERMALLTRLLSEPVPILSTHPGVTPTTVETWSLFRLMARARNIYGVEMLGPIVISMSRAAADVLSVLLLARWTGCDVGLQICPLFESVDDLKAAPGILASLFTSPIYRKHLATCDEAQMVMIGYSDSNKDGGYLTANWALYQAQEEITRVAQEHGINLTIFHGRGGTVARGGGPANRAIRAQPAGSIQGRFRLTEQGEIIAARYSNKDLAHRHLEQVINAVLLASASTFDKGGAAGWRDAMDQMAVAALRAYRALVYETPGFIDFWQAATPLDEIKRLYIGSRPATRSSNTEVTAIRAIPWVFSWMQSRFNLPGWFGLGTGLNALHSRTTLREMYAGWPFFKTLLDNTEISLLKADMDIASLYTELVPDRKMAAKMYDCIRIEYEKTREAVLSINGNADLLDDEPFLKNAIRLRNPYVDPLNYIQVETLHRLRALPDPESAQAEALREVVVLTINGIAAGLRNTG